MHHRNTRHPETVRTCTFFMKGSCDFPDSVCWFNHTLGDKNIATFNAQTLKKYKCGFCGETFRNKPEFMKHRKLYHQDYVMPCRDYQNGVCVHGSDICGFKHDDIQLEVHSAQAEIQESQP